MNIEWLISNAGMKLGNPLLLSRISGNMRILILIGGE
jgi:hypothetical protein